MREIKFRAIANLPGCDSHLVYWEIGKEISFTYIDKSTIEQFAGLLDANGKEIYEGDILDCHANGKSPVVYENGAFICKQDGVYVLLLLCVQFQRGEVISNIHRKEGD